MQPLGRSGHIALLIQRFKDLEQIQIQLLKGRAALSGFVVKIIHNIYGIYFILFINKRALGFIRFKH